MKISRSGGRTSNPNRVCVCVSLCTAKKTTFCILAIRVPGTRFGNTDFCGEFCGSECDVGTSRTWAHYSEGRKRLLFGPDTFFSRLLCFKDIGLSKTHVTKGRNGPSGRAIKKSGTFRNAGPTSTICLL